MNQEQLQLRDIHPPLLLPEEPNYAIFVAGVLAFLFAALLLHWFFRRRKKGVKLTPAHERAFTELSIARSRMNLDTGLQYASEVSDVLRRYIEERFHVQSTRQTTKEFFTCLTANLGVKQITLSEKHLISLRECLDQCDMAKFALRVPDVNNMEKMESAVKDFIEDTREDREGGN